MKSRAICTLAVSVALLVMACGGTPAATAVPYGGAAPPSAPAESGVPAAFRGAVCRALNPLADVMTAIQVMPDHMSAGNLGAVSADIDAAKSAITKAQANLDQVPPWSPGDQMVRSLSTALERWQEAFNELAVAVDGLDQQGLRDALVTVRSGTDEMNRATENLKILQETYDFTCQ